MRNYRDAGRADVSTDDGPDQYAALELLCDLTFVVAFGQASSELAHLLAAEGHYSAGLIGFGFATFGICWAWITPPGRERSHRDGRAGIRRR